MDGAIESEFHRFRRGISLEKLEETWAFCKKDWHCRRFKIIESKVYGPEGKLKNLLLELVKKYRVPDVDFISYNGDILRKIESYVPIFGSAKERDYDRVVLFIDHLYDSAEWSGLVELINHSRVDWADKINKMFWRGGTTDGVYTSLEWMNNPRGRLVYESLAFPNVDAAFVNLWEQTTPDPQFFIDNGYTSSNVSPADQQTYKYHIDIDGVTSTYSALQWKLLTGSVVFKQITSDVMWFYPQLIAWKHYIPLQKDLSDLQEKLRWALEHDKEAQEIANNGREFVLTHLMPDHILKYCYKTLVKYASLQLFDPTK